jgi:ABC-type sugar transport system substrate-binding protein
VVDHQIEGGNAQPEYWPPEHFLAKGARSQIVINPFARTHSFKHPIHPYKEKKMNKSNMVKIFGILLVLSMVLSACGTKAAATPTTAKAFGQAKCAPNCTYKDMTMCYPQLGAESDWRTANTASFKDQATKDGFKLVFSDAQQKQENQISAIRSCIQQGVSVIALPPVVEPGWDAVLQEAKDAGIPVIIVDRSVSADPAMYASHIGSDMELEGKRAGEAMNKLLPNGGSIIELSGTTGSGAATGRAKGFRETLNQNIKIIDSQTGNFTRAEGKPVMEAFLKKYAGQIQGAFIHNDDMAIGAIEAMKAAGLNPGDLKVVSVDGTRGGFQAMVDGWIQTDVECNPLLGPQVAEMALKIMNGQSVDKNVLTNETVYYPDKAAELLPSRQY